MPRFIAPSARAGRIAVPGGTVRYRVMGGGPGIPLLTLHGGPGGGMVSLKPLRRLADERPVIFYDQLGCGRSDTPNDLSLWTVDRFIEEIDAVRRHLGLEEVHLFGHSWGGMLAIDYLLQRPAGVRSVILSNTIASMSAYLHEAWRLVEEMPAVARDALLRHRTRIGGSLSYQAALMWLRLRHVVRLRFLPDLLPILTSMVLMLRSPSFWYMWGADDLHVTGTLHDWERVHRLYEIDTPALVLAGEFDETTPRLAHDIAEGLRDARVHILEGCSHMAFFERPRAYMDTVRPFLEAHDALRLRVAR